MNNSLKNIFSFIKEALELKNKNIYRLSDYEIHLDLGSFFNKFKDFIDPSNYLELSINSEQTILKLKYIKDDKKKPIPKIPELLGKYIFLKDGNDIISKIDNLEVELHENGLLELYRDFDELIKETNKYNHLIDEYNDKYMDFYNIYKRINDYEEKIEIVFGSKLLLWSDCEGHKIERYIYEANLDINVNSIDNVITFVINDEKFKGFASDFLNLDSYKIKDVNSFYDYIKQFNESIIDTDFDVNAEAKKYINYISLENQIKNKEVSSGEELKANVTYLFDNCGIIVRNKNVKLWIEDLINIISMCDNTKFKSPILNMFEVDFSDDDKVQELLFDKTYDDTKDDNVLFPLPSNDEQFNIVDKVKESNIVLVKGPPGTGKSHTIANLLSHYISEGKKVIVTSEKSKALEVLRDKLPTQIRSLSLALLSSKGVDKDLEHSINNVLKNQVDDKELPKIKKAIEKLTEKLNVVYNSKQTVNKKIIELMSKDTVCHKEELNSLMNFRSDGNLTLMEIAKWLDNNRNYAFVPLGDVENYSYTNPVEFFDKLDDICDDIRNNCYAISSSVPEYESFKTNDIELYIKERIGYKNYTLANPKLISSIKQSALNDEIIKKLEELLSTVSKVYLYLDKEFVRSNIKYEVFISKLSDIVDLMKENKSNILLTEEALYDYEVVCDDPVNTILVLDDLLELYDKSGKINIINKLKVSSLIKRLDNLKVNGSFLTKDNVSRDLLFNIRNILNYEMIVNTIRKKINQVLEVDLFEKLNINKNKFGKYQNDILDILDGVINFEKNVVGINKCLETVVNKNLFTINYLNEDEDFINSVYNDLKYYVTVNSSEKSTKAIIADIRNFYKDYNLQNLEKVLISIETSQLEEFINSKNQLLREIGIINKYIDLKKLYSNFVSDKGGLIDNYIYNLSIEDRKYVKSNLDSILKYHYVEKYYLALEEKEIDLPSLYVERENLVREEKKVIEELVATKGWYYQNINMTSGINLSLNKWINLKKKLGSGKGKNANLLLRQMREEMNVAKNAIPVWIMPIDKLIEQYPFTNDSPFDVLIMDESSQSSIYSISALSRAKKVIIVGDDKQISPTNAFTSLDGINDIRTKYLRNNSWDLQISRDTSIYDIIQTICGNKKITLTEHFRCLPEIIHYSNKTFYNMEINPLKVRGKDNTISKPIKTIYVPNAVCKRSGNLIMNEAEMNRILTLLSDISVDKEYDNKTIGIIALQNNMSKYIQKLIEAIMKRFGEEFITERKIKVGTTYDFQGDERDVIILSMGVSSICENGDRYSFRALTTQEFDRSFNVAASRAKEQMILVHSVTLEELSPNCNRYKLLEYCLNYDSEREKSYEELFESVFERDIYYHLTSKGYSLTPQFVIGNYRLDFVLTNENNQKIAIECDGDKYHGIEELDNDLKRQSILERCGWKFVRIRASEYYYDKEKCINKVVEMVQHYLKGNNSITFNTSNDYSLADKNNNFNKEVNVVNDSNVDDEDFDNAFQKDYSNKQETVEEFGPSQFKYMTLFANGISRKEIAEFFGVEYDTVKKSLQVVCAKYNCDTAEECIPKFNKHWSGLSNYNDVIKTFNDTNKMGMYVGADFKQESMNLFEKKKIGNEVVHSVSRKQITDVVKKALLSKSDIVIGYTENKKKFIITPVNYYEANGIYYLKAYDQTAKQLKLFKFDKIYEIKEK